MFTTSTLLAIAAVANAATFTLTASLCGSSLDGTEVNAAGTSFHLGGEPATYCPLTNQTLCPNLNETVFAAMSALWVQVPGGQQVYVRPSGALGFTQAHSAYVPPGSYIGGFVNVTTSSNLTAFNWRAPDNSTEGVLGCPKTSATFNETARYQVFARTPAFNQTGCVVLDGLLPHVNVGGAFGAWQYT